MKEVLFELSVPASVEVLVEKNTDIGTDFDPYRTNFRASAFTMHS